MTKLSNKKIYDYIMLKLDKHGSPYFTPAQVSDFFNEAYLEWIPLTAKSGELTDKRRQDLHELVRVLKIGDNRIIDLNVLDPAPCHIWALFADFNFECKGVVKKYTRPVEPIQWDTYAIRADDPYNQPTDTFPGYVQYADNSGRPLLRIESKSLPRDVEIVYIKEPILMDAKNKPNDTIEVKRTQQMEIIDICLAKLELNIQNQFGYQATTQVEIPRNE